jgi:hypothetical protein
MVLELAAVIFDLFHQMLHIVVDEPDVRGLSEERGGDERERGHDEQAQTAPLASGPVGIDHGSS